MCIFTAPLSPLLMRTFKLQRDIFQDTENGETPEGATSNEGESSQALAADDQTSGSSSTEITEDSSPEQRSMPQGSVVEGVQDASETGDGGAELAGNAIDAFNAAVAVSAEELEEQSQPDFAPFYPPTGGGHRSNSGINSGGDGHFGTVAFDPADAEVVLDGLNDRQKEAVSTVDGPLLIVAGPGSGKTRVLTARVAYLLAGRKARPYQILALTFTNKAAREMKERIGRLVDADVARGIWMGTFHSVFGRILRREAEKIGYTSDYSIYDTDDQERILRSLMSDYHIDPKQFTVRSLRSYISGAKNQMVTPTQYSQMAASLAEEKAAQLYQPYQDVLRRANALDFDDMLIKPIELFRNNPETLESYQDRWRFIHIDEYQDTNQAQYQLANLLSSKHRNLCVVGDDAQSIYAFRGADIANILSFQRDYEEAKVVRLEQNYRSTKKILKLADSIIKNNRDQLDKSLWTDNPDGEDIVLLEALSEKDEAQKIEFRVRDLKVRAGYRYDDFAVLYRTNSQSRAIEDALRRGGIPYRVVGGVSFYQRKEIKDVLAYLRILVNPLDVASISRVINYPTRGIGIKSLGKVLEYASERGLALWQALRDVESIGVPGMATKSIRRFVDMMEGHQKSLLTTPADQVARAVVQDSGLLKELRKDNTPENLVRWENVQELVSAIAEFVSTRPEEATLSSFLQEVSLFTDADEQDFNESKVTLMTLHASKGLEYEVVFVTGLEEGLFPLARASQDAKDLEEERRLFYVGVTRAGKQLFLSSARSRYRFGEQQSCIRSRFLDEADDDVIRTESERTSSRSDRFTNRTKGFSSYEKLDPDYYKNPLQISGADKKKLRKTVIQRSDPSAASNSGRRVVYDEGEGGQIVPGMKVTHDQFGEGKVLAVEGNGAQTKATVFFKDYGQKKLVLKFARLQVIG